MYQINSTKKIVLASIMTAIIIVLCFIPGFFMPISPVPIVLQNLGILLAASLLSPIYGFLSIGVFFLFVIIGFPFLTGGHGGISVFLGPTFGYLIAWILLPFILGNAIKYLNPKKNTVINYLIILIFGVFVMYLLGALGLHIVQPNISYLAALSTNAFYLPADLIKVLIVTLILKRFNKIKI
ncbi:biotin transporter BioY [Lactobacillus sp. S2-2]|uniref:biotin transporter BioY n=1 Tax=Lactobacillus sp. S2-2 TaxID=2692917 RepID=UPI001F410357|nr:biotin transporter BioY [Lactobacillus sp. S2-2]MCF6515575.1 biotin transporter BioY [Lactobacillus sp. S2-2]